VNKTALAERIGVDVRTVTAYERGEYEPSDETPTRIARGQGVSIFSMAEDTAEVDAFSLWRDTTPFVFLNTLKSAERSRFDAAQELGHLVMHRHGGPPPSAGGEPDADSPIVEARGQPL
jgi:Zn-dependent peptidase ImmA (M78 family)